MKKKQVVEDKCYCGKRQPSQTVGRDKNIVYIYYYLLSHIM